MPAGRPDAERRDKGPGKVEGVFYNPAMRLNRDLSVLVTEAWAERHAARRTDGRPFRVYDGLAATGARAVRLAKEVRAPVEVVANDRDPDAVALIRENARTNDVEGRVVAVQGDFAFGLAGGRADLVDVDPFGSPAPFLDTAIRLVRDRGLLALTATDMTALCGVFPEPCRRRYDAEPWHGPGMHECAVRILIGAAVRAAARHDVALTPVLSHATDHYVRTYLAVRNGAKRADAAVARLGRAVEEADGTRHVQDRDALVPADVVRAAGPLWGGALHDKALLSDLVARLGDHAALHHKPLSALLSLAMEEAGAPPLHYEVGEWGRRLGSNPPSREGLFAALRAHGHTATRTQFGRDAFKTDATGPQLTEAYRAAAQDAQKER